MKKTSILLLGAIAVLSSCGMLSQSASSGNDHRFQDGIYGSVPSFKTKEEKMESKAAADDLVSTTKESLIYLFGDRKDTIMIPQNMSARIQFDQKVGGTTVTIGENPYDWRWDLENRYGYYYGPYSIGSSWYWSRHYTPYWNPYWSPYWGTWSYSPWRYYDPWYYGGFYDPWYYGGFYDPWCHGGYWGGYWSWHNHWHHHHHHGWYDHHHHPHHGPSHVKPQRGNRYHGLRAQTERNYGSARSTGSNQPRSAIRTSNGTVRGGMSIGNTVSRSSSVSRRPSGTVSRSSSTASRPAASSSSSSSTTYYRRPASTSSAATRSSSVSRDSDNSRSHSYDGSKPHYSRSSSGYSRSSSDSGFSRSSSGYSGGSSSGGYSRSGSSGGYSRSSSSGYRR